MGIQFRLLPVPVAILAVGVALAGCGGGQNVDKVLNQTFTGKKNVRSGKLRLSLTVNAKGARGVSGPIRIGLSGPFQSQGDKKIPKFDISLSISAGSTNFGIGGISTGSAGFLRVGGQAYAVPAQTFAQFQQGIGNAARSQPDRRGNYSLGALGLHPRDWLKDAKNEGDEDVAGTSTTHISAKVNLGKFVDDLGTLLSKSQSLGVGQTAQLPSLTAQNKQQIQRSIKNASVDVYSGKDDRILRRLGIKFDFSLPASQTTSGLRSGSLIFDLVLAELNKSQTIEAPGNPRPLSELGGVLGGLGNLGGLGGLGGASGGGGQTGGGSAGNQAYAKCIQDAGGDARKALNCASLLK